MNPRYMTKTAVYLLLLKAEDGYQKVCLQKRSNTGFADGCWDFSATGHLEAGETLQEAIIREAKEELDITLTAEQLVFKTYIHLLTDMAGPYHNFFFLVSDFAGEVKIGEPEKCGELKWFDIKSLPDNLIEDRKLAADNILKGIIFAEVGWE